MRLEKLSVYDVYTCLGGEPSPRADVARGEPSPGADVAGVSPVRCRCGRGEPSPGADVAAAHL